MFLAVIVVNYIFNQIHQDKNSSSHSTPNQALKYTSTTKLILRHWLDVLFRCLFAAVDSNKVFLI